MPDRPTTVATYAISASLAALVLGYVFGPSIFPDDGFLSRDGNNRNHAVGLSNPANDCFINSTLQALAGLKTLRNYLSNLGPNERVHDGSTVFASRALEARVVSLALKSKLDELNATSSSKRTISAADFIKALEFAFGASISRKQQDAQEFLQIVAQRLEEEFHASTKAAKVKDSENNNILTTKAIANSDTRSEVSKEGQDLISEGDIFPLEGTVESQIECLTCSYKPKPNRSSFVTLTLNVPQKNSTTIDECLDGFFKVEVIDEYKCDRCQVEHALKSKERQLGALEIGSDKASELETQIQNLRRAYDDPETYSNELQDNGRAPKQRISKHAHISAYPTTLALHLSRSIFSTSALSMKNAAKVQFPEILKLGFLERKTYRLACVVTHRGGHNSGHYETLRRQSDELSDSEFSEKEAWSDDSNQNNNSGSHEGFAESTEPKSKAKAKTQTRKQSKWWCISDAKIRECSTAEVLQMQKDVYLLFYELQQSPIVDE